MRYRVMQFFTSPRSALGSGHPRMAFVLLVLAALAFGGWGLWRAFGPQPVNAGEQLRTQASRMDALEQEVATLKRSDQISRDANRDLQGTLRRRGGRHEQTVGEGGDRRGGRHGASLAAA